MYRSHRRHYGAERGRRRTPVGDLEIPLRDKTGLVPAQPMLSRKTDLKALPPEDDVVIWMGHSTFYLHLAGHRILIDPVLSSYASPLFFINKAFPGSNIYTADDFPPIDVLLLTHDHWDHLDYPSLMALRPKIRDIVCPLASARTSSSGALIRRGSTRRFGSPK